jgi:hypothetical protein
MEGWAGCKGVVLVGRCCASQSVLQTMLLTPLPLQHDAVTMCGQVYSWATGMETQSQTLDCLAWRDSPGAAHGCSYKQLQAMPGHQRPAFDDRLKWHNVECMP